MIAVREPTSERPRRFLAVFLRNRRASREFYDGLAPEKLDYRLVDAKKRRSDSPRESLVHQLYVTRNYVYSVKTGRLQWGPGREAMLVVPAWQSFDKRRLLAEMARVERELFDLLARPDIESRTVCIPWSPAPMAALDLLHGLIDHEILQAGANRALTDDLGSERYPA